MKLRTLTLIANIAALPTLAQEHEHGRVSPVGALSAKPRISSEAAVANPNAASRKNAEEFIGAVERELPIETEYGNRVSWIAANFITPDTDWLSAKVTAELASTTVARAKSATKFDGVDVDPRTRRKLELLKRSLVLPAPEQPGASQELAELQVRLGTAYSTGKVAHRGNQLTLDDIEDIMRTSRDPNELKALWERWHAVAIPMRQAYARMVELANSGARALGYFDTGALWRSWYDMPADGFSRTTERLWSQLAPIYRNLHCYARARLNERYGDAVQPRTGAIRADLLGDMWAQQWGNVYDLLAPKNGSLGYDLSEALVQHGYDAVREVKVAESFYVSLGFPPLPESFWSGSLFVRPRDREVECHASAWDIDGKEDVRIKACLRVNADDFYTAHHELGHVYYYRAYQDQPAVFRDGANDGFHEAIGDFIGLSSVTPIYLHKLGLIQQVPGEEADIPFLLRMALEKIAFLPFGYIVDKWRWQVFSDQTAPADYNAAWWALRTKYQGIIPPGPRPPDAFDPGAKEHIASSTPYMRYFLATIYQFQFHRAACRIAGWNGPLNRCSIYGNTEAGKRFNEMLRLGASRPWQEALATFTGERDIDASAIADYFAPLERWLTEQNTNETCGW
jgi:peptidyl-dipeptidase A